MDLDFIKSEGLRERLLGFAVFLNKPIEEVVEKLLLTAVGKTGSPTSAYRRENFRELGEEEKMKVISLLPLETNVKLAEDFNTNVALIKSVRIEETRRLIKETMGDVGDQEIGEKVGLGRGHVSGIRLSLGFKLNRKSKREKAVANKVDFDDLRNALTKGGYTQTEYLRQHHLGITRERLRQICEEEGVPHGREARTSEWYFARLVRQYGKEEFGNKEWVAERFEEAGRNVYGLAAVLKVTFRSASQILDFHGIERKFRCESKDELVEVTCSNPACNKKFKRSKLQVASVEQTGKRLGKVFRPVCGTPCRSALQDLDVKVGRVVLNPPIGGGKIKIDREWLRENYKEFSDAEIAEKFQMHKRSVTNLRRQLGLNREKIRNVDQI